MVTKAITGTNLNRFLNCSTVIQWNNAIRASVNEGNPTKAFLLFRQMKQSGFEPNFLTFPFIAKACAKLSNCKLAEIIHTHVVKSPFCYDIFVQTAFLDMYCKCNQLNVAYKLFEEMPDRDMASWNAMMMGFAQMGLSDKVLILLVQMRLSDFQPDSITVIALTQSSCNSASGLNALKAVHCLGTRIGVGDDISVSNTWISAYAKFNDLCSSKMVFDEISVGLRTVISWNSLISGYAQFERFYEAVSLYRNMCHEEKRPDLCTITSLISSCIHPEAISEGKQIHSHGIKIGCDSNISLINTLISMYSKCGDMDSARYLFDTMLERTCVSWTVMINGYAEEGDLVEAFDLFGSMEEAGEKPDLVTLISLLSACGQTGNLELGRWINRYIISNNFGQTVMVCNALIDMYAKCGSMESAHETFKSMSNRTIVSWTTMISGSGLNGEFEEALNLFSQMLDSGVKPNHVTFLAVLQACTHAGLLEKGLEYFDLMEKAYKLCPTLEHYSCIADLLGRKGKLREALEFIQKMPLKPDAGVWGALLGSCKIHNEIEIGEFVAQKLFELEPEAAVSYVAMANIFASKGKWDNVAKTRKMMKSNRVKKSPGKSFVQVNGAMHSFTVEDRCHQEGILIYEVLDGLALQLKKDRLEQHMEFILYQHELEK
ncbi:pentatricopeptide repeat-containing protein At4g19191, mitochondrial-like [Papaver somniferum]|uniref:pentatricopeptide repeat-containing protein At4g19191, mitochondrial-like n=1 Tax=Papaver somniferum TaxID=3469 RepID=UPI000E70132E|nr:pentatricopeptide repeat-containing protein At4g19191, mitochondrial-like [Papaver somniferum]